MVLDNWNPDHYRCKLIIMDAPDSGDVDILRSLLFLRMLKSDADPHSQNVRSNKMAGRPDPLMDRKQQDCRDHINITILSSELWSGLGSLRVTSLSSANLHLVI